MSMDEKEEYTEPRTIITLMEETTSGENENGNTRSDGGEC